MASRTQQSAQKKGDPAWHGRCDGTGHSRAGTRARQRLRRRAADCFPAVARLAQQDADCEGRRTGHTIAGAERFTIHFDDGIRFEATKARIRPHTSLTIGSRVEARFRDGRWYPGTITKLPVPFGDWSRWRKRVKTKCFRTSCEGTMKNLSTVSCSVMDKDHADRGEPSTMSTGSGEECEHEETNIVRSPDLSIGQKISEIDNLDGVQSHPVVNKNNCEIHIHNPHEPTDILQEALNLTQILEHDDNHVVTHNLKDRCVDLQYRENIDAGNLIEDQKRAEPQRLEPQHPTHLYARPEETIIKNMANLTNTEYLVRLTNCDNMTVKVNQPLHDKTCQRDMPFCNQERELYLLDYQELKTPQTEIQLMDSTVQGPVEQSPEPVQFYYPEAESLQDDQIIINSEKKDDSDVALHRDIYNYMTFLDTMSSTDNPSLQGNAPTHNGSSLLQNQEIASVVAEENLSSPVTPPSDDSWIDQSKTYNKTFGSTNQQSEEPILNASLFNELEQLETTDVSPSCLSNEPRNKNISSPIIEAPEQSSEPSNGFLSEKKSNSLLTVANVPKGKYVYSKKNYCKFCSKPLNKVSRHIESAHPFVEEVRKIRTLPKKSLERKRLQEKIRRKGNFLHNQEVLKNKKGTFMPQVRYNSHNPASAKDYLPCPHCKGFFKKEFISVHHKRCFLNIGKNESKRAAVRGKMMLLESDTTSESFKTYIMADMISDQITDTIIGDQLIMKMGEKLYNKLKKRKNHNYIRQRMRQTARFLLTAKSIDSTIECLEDILKPENFDLLIGAVKKLANFDEKSGKFAKGALPLKLGHDLNLCATVLRSRAIRMGDNSLKRKVQDFSDLMMSDYAAINSHALATLKEVRFNKPKYLPLANDVKKLTSYITEQLAHHSKELMMTGDVQTYTRVAHLTLASILLFNRRRSGEIQEITLDNFNKGCQANLSCDVSDDLGLVENLLLNKLKRIEIMGKKCRGVCVLLRPQHLSALNQLLAHRKSIGISETEPLIFARVSKHSKTPIDACSVIRSITNEANLEKPELIRSRELRKHIATSSQLMDLSSVELQQLANFMGHDLNVHMDYYRLPDDIMQITKVGRLLIAAEEGRYSRGKAMTLSNIPIEEEDFEGVSNCHEDVTNSSSSGKSVTSASTSNHEKISLLLVYLLKTWKTMVKTMILTSLKTMEMTTPLKVLREAIATPKRQWRMEAKIVFCHLR